MLLQFTLAESTQTFCLQQIDFYLWYPLCQPLPSVPQLFSSSLCLCNVGKTLRKPQCSLFTASLFSLISLCTPLSRQETLIDSGSIKTSLFMGIFLREKPLFLLSLWTCIFRFLPYGLTLTPILLKGKITRFKDIVVVYYVPALFIQGNPQSIQASCWWDARPSDEICINSRDIHSKQTEWRTTSAHIAAHAYS